MTLVVTQFAPASDPATFRLSVEVDGVEHVFVLTINSGELTTVSAPESLHALCAAVGLDPSTLLRLPIRLRAEHSLELPLSFPTPRQLHSVPEGELWRTPASTSERIRRVRFGAHISRESLDCARRFLGRHVDASFFPRAFEYQVVDRTWDELGEWAHEVDLLEHRASNRRELIVPKRNGSVRMATRLDVLETVLLTACVFELGPVAERARVPVAEGVVHSFRFDPDGDGLWSNECNYGSYRARLLELAHSAGTSFVLETDISSFYHKVTPDVAVHALERAGGDRRLLEGIRRLLRSSSTAGLPVGPHFSSLFAEAVLNDVDATLLSAGAIFARFNDDYRFFCKTAEEVAMREAQFAEALWQAGGLTTQREKRGVIGVEEYVGMLQSGESAWLSNLEQSLLEWNPYADVEDEELPESVIVDVDAARALLNEQLTRTIPDTSLCRKAFSALPLLDRLEMIPTLLRHLPRIGLVAQNISDSVHVGVPRHPETNEELSPEILQGLYNLAGVTSEKNDFMRLWLANAFVSKDMDSPAGLVECCHRWPQDLMLLREVIIAFRGSFAGSTSNASDPWLRRAQLLGGGTPSLSTGGSPRERWESRLDSAISDHAGDESLFSPRTGTTDPE